MVMKRTIISTELARMEEKKKKKALFNVFVCFVSTLLSVILYH